MISRRWIAAAAAIPFAVILSACGDVEAVTPDGGEPVGADKAPPSAAVEHGSSPLAGATRIDERGVDRVEEVLATGGYAYLRLASAEPGVWYVIAGAPPKVGATIRYRGYAELRDYRSPSLDREFERVVFASARPQGETQ